MLLKDVCWLRMWLNNEQSSKEERFRDRTSGMKVYQIGCISQPPLPFHGSIIGSWGTAVKQTNESLIGFPVCVGAFASSLLSLQPIMTALSFNPWQIAHWRSRFFPFIFTFSYIDPYFHTWPVHATLHTGQKNFYAKFSDVEGYFGFEKLDIGLEFLLIYNHSTLCISESKMCGLLQVYMVYGLRSQTGSKKGAVSVVVRPKKFSIDFEGPPLWFFFHGIWLPFIIDRLSF